MAVDPYVPTRPEDAPRRSVGIPPAKGWLANRPGDLGSGQPDGDLFGSPGPDGGYALTLAKRFRDRIQVVAPETAHDALAVAAELAMKRASMFGRAPVSPDLEVAFTLFGWLGDPAAELVEWRRLAAAGTGHHYARRRALVDAVPEAVLRSPGDAAQDPGWWRELIAVPAA